jgi:hypothetical protein
MTKIISGFPGVGKSHLGKRLDNEVKVLDLESSDFKGENRWEDYKNEIKNQVGKVDVLFVSSHTETRKILSELGLNFYLVYPDRSLKDEYLRRYRERGNSEEFIDMMDKNFDLFIDSIENEEVRCAKIKLTGENEYLDSFLNFMNFLDVLKENEK